MSLADLGDLIPEFALAYGAMLAVVALVEGWHLLTTAGRAAGGAVWRSLRRASSPPTATPTNRGGGVGVPLGGRWP